MLRLPRVLHLAAAAQTALPILVRGQPSPVEREVRLRGLWRLQRVHVAGARIVPLEKGRGDGPGDEKSGKESEVQQQRCEDAPCLARSVLGGWLRDGGAELQREGKERGASKGLACARRRLGRHATQARHT